MKMREIVLPAAVKRIMRILQEAGYPTYVVGGSVRDFLLGVVPHDWDICTAAPVEEIQRLFRSQGYGIAPTGRNFGTVMVLHKRTPYEITVFRKKDEVGRARKDVPGNGAFGGELEGGQGVPYSSLLSDDLIFNSLPSSNLPVENPYDRVERFLNLHSGSLGSLSQVANPRGFFRPSPHIPFDDPRAGSALYEDLGLRDFTINAIAWSPQEGFIDPYGGMQDLEDGILRCPGLASERLSEDPLRILRALRFASVSGFSIHYDLSETIHNLYSLLGNVPVERITAEFYRFMDGPAIRVASLLRQYTDVFCYLMPELRPMVGFDQRNHNHIYDVWEHTLKAMEACKLDDRILKFTILFHDTGKPHVFTVDDRGVGHFYGHAIVSCQICQQITDRMRFDKKTAQEVNVLVEVHDARVEGNTRSVRRWLNRLGMEQFKRLIVMKRCDAAGQNPYYWPDREAYISSVERAFQALMSQEAPCYSLKDLAVNGKDLMAIGYRGSELGRCLKRLLDEVLDENIPNRRDLLLEKARQWQRNKV